MPEIVTNHSRQTSAVSRIGLGIVVLTGVLLGLLISGATLYLGLVFTFAPPVCHLGPSWSWAS
jgi:hypothetical protein